MSLPNLTELVYLAGGVVSGLVVALKIIAPRTRTKKDDWVLEKLEIADKYLPGKGDGSAAKRVDAVSREPIRDHRK
jgi:hypothetical protein